MYFNYFQKIFLTHKLSTKSVFALKQRCCIHFPALRIFMLNISNNKICSLYFQRNISLFHSKVDLNEVEVNTMIMLPPTRINAENIMKYWKKLATSQKEKQLSIHDLEMNEKFKCLFHIVDQYAQSERPNPYILFSCIRSLRELSLTNNSYMLDSLNNQLLWNLRHSNISLLVAILNFYLPQRSVAANVEIKIIEECQLIIERRWVELKKFSDITVLLKHASSFNKSFINKLEDKITELVGVFSHEERQRLLVFLSSLNWRALFVLRSLSYYLTRSSVQFNAQQIAFLLSGLHKLNFPDIPLIERLCSDLEMQINMNTDSAILCSSMISLGLLKFRRKELFELVANWIMDKDSQLDAKCMVSILYTFATTNYKPLSLFDLEKVFDKYINYNSLKDENCWLDYVWSRIVLGIANTQFYSTIFASSFISKLTSVGAILKLQAVASWAHSLGHLVPQHVHFQIETVKSSRQEKYEQLITDVQNALKTFIPHSCFQKESQLPFGISVDGVFGIDKHNNPLPIKHGQAIRSIALCVWGFHDLTLPDCHINGANQIKVSVLRNLGYLLLEVPYTEFNPNDSDIEKVKYLQHKFTSLLKY